MDPKQLNALVHDREAAVYDLRFLIDQGPRLGDELLRELRDILGDQPAATRLLDVACGTGFAALGAAHSQLAPRIHGCDLSTGMLAETAKHAGKAGLEISLAACDAESLCYRSGSFDLILARGALHHVPDPVAMLQECRRVLAPGGAVVCLAEPTAEGEQQVGAVVGTLWRVLENAKRFLGREPTEEQKEAQQWELASMAANLHTFDTGSLQATAVKAGFEDVTVGTAWWAWVLALGVNYYLAGEFESLWSKPLVRRAARTLLDGAARFDHAIAERLIPDRYHATVWAVLR